MRRPFIVSVIFLCVVLVASVSAQSRTDREVTLGAKLEAIQRAIQEKGANWTAGMTEIFQLPEEERMLMYGCADSISQDKIPEEQQLMRYSWQPEKFDWRLKDGADWTTPVKNQGRCGSCVAFATIGTLEGQLNIFYDDPYLNMDLSEQYLFACGGGTCNEGMNTDLAFRYVLGNGVPDEDCFPYTSGLAGIDRPCGDACPDWQERILKPSCYGAAAADKDIKAPADIKEQILQGPVCVTMAVFEDFDSYTGGIYQHVWGQYEAGHAIVMVGWDDTTEPPCWIVRNSWGSGWGERGYFRIRMGTNEVGIEDQALYARFGDVPEGRLSSGGHQFGDVDVGDSENWLLNIYNEGGAPLEIHEYQSNKPNYFISSPASFPQTVAPGGTLGVTLVFTPDTLGEEFGRIRFPSNSCHFLSVKLRGTGVIHNVRTSQKSIEKTMVEGDIMTVPLTMTYIGDTTLTYQVEILREWLSVQPDSGTLETGGSVDFTVTLDASNLEPGEYRTNILIKTDDPTDKLVVVHIVLSTEEAAGVALTIPPTAIPIDRTIQLGLSIDNKNRIEMPIRDVALHIGYDATFMELREISSTLRTEHMTAFQWSEAEPGQITLSISDGNGNCIVPGTEPIAQFFFEARDGISCGDSVTLTITEATLIDTLGSALEVRLNNDPCLLLCKGDVNANGTIEIDDVIEVIRLILENGCFEEWTPECWSSDYNDDGSIDAMDLVCMVNVILDREAGSD